MNRILYYLKESLRSLMQGKMMTLISVVSIAIALFVVTVPIVGIVNLDKWFQVQEESATLSIYFSDTLDDSAAFFLAEELTVHFPNGSVRYSTPVEEYLSFKGEKMGPELLRGVEGNPFGAALYVDSLPEPPTMHLISTVQEVAGVDDVVFRNEWIGKLQQFRKNVLWGVTIGVFIVTIMVSFTVSNTVKLTVYAREDLIKNMQYLGASDWYVKIPFMLEGILQGVLGAIIASFGLTFLGLLLSEYLFWFDRLSLFTILIIFGVVVGFVGSLRAVSKFFN